jgi:rhodanese-related sulfurtransferase
VGAVVLTTVAAASSSMAFNDEAKKSNYDKARETAQSNFGKFPDVPTISAEEVARKADSPKTIIVDVRAEAETSVSMLRGALTKQKFEDKYFKDGSFHLEPGTTVLVYCTLGIRSARYCQHLIQNGVDCRNMEGIVVMTHFVDNLYANGEPTRKVHTCGPSWNFVSANFEPVC